MQHIRVSSIMGRSIAPQGVLSLVNGYSPDNKLQTCVPLHVCAGRTGKLLLSSLCANR